MVRSYQGLGTPVAAMVGCARLRTLMGSLPLNSKMGTSIVLRGKMGTGKTKVGEVFGWMYHPRRRSDHRDIPYAAADRVRRLNAQQYPFQKLPQGTPPLRREELPVLSQHRDHPQQTPK